MVIVEAEEREKVIGSWTMTYKELKKKKNVENVNSNNSQHSHLCFYNKAVSMLTIKGTGRIIIKSKDNNSVRAVGQLYY